MLSRRLMTNEIFTNTFIKTPSEAQLMQIAATDWMLHAQVEIYPNSSIADRENAANAHYESGVRECQARIVPSTEEYADRRIPEDYRNEAREALERGAVLVRLTVTPDYHGEVTARSFWVKLGSLKEGRGGNTSLF